MDTLPFNVLSLKLTLNEIKVHEYIQISIFKMV